MTNHVDYEINKELGECYLFMGEYEKARGYYTKAVECDSANPAPYIGLAAISLGMGNMQDAYDLYCKANAVKESDRSLSGMAMIECEQGRHEEAFSHFVRALEYNAVNMVAINGLLQVCHFLGRLAEVIAPLEAALALNSDESIRYALAACLLSVGREDEAKQHLEALLGENPANTEAQQLYAQFAA